MAKSRESALEELLVAAGHPPLDDLDAASQEVLNTCKGRRAAVRALARRGWALWFDLENDFFVVGAHARVVRDIAAAGGAEVEVEDAWIPDEGWVLRVERDGRAAFFLRPRKHLSDWGDLDLVLAACRAALPERRVLCLRTGDQTVLLAVLPEGVAAEASAYLSVEDDEDVAGVAEVRELGPDEAREAFAAARRAAEAEAAERKRRQGPTARAQRPTDLSLAPPLVRVMLHENAVSGLPLFHNERMYLAVQEPDATLVLALDWEDGKECWSRRLERVGNNLAKLVLIDDGIVCAQWDAFTILDHHGCVVETHDVAGPAVGIGYGVAKGDRICCVGLRSADEGYLDQIPCMVRPRGNHVLWQRDLEAGYGEPVWSGDQVFVPLAGKRVAALSASDGATRWQHEMGARIMRIAAPTPERLLAATSDGDIICLHARDGTVAWRSKLPIGRFHVATDGSIHALFNEGYRRIAGHSGEVLAHHDLTEWHKQSGRPNIFGMCATATHAYFVAGMSLHAMRIDDGTIDWEVELAHLPDDEFRGGTWIDHSEPVIVRGRLHVSTIHAWHHAYQRPS